MTEKRFTVKPLMFIEEQRNGIFEVGNERLFNNEIVRLLNNFAEENEQLKKELKVYRKLASCSNCRYHDYDWDINDGYGGEEYEICDKGNDVIDGICEDWEEF